MNAPNTTLAGTRVVNILKGNYKLWEIRRVSISFVKL
jgi:hypothetical protein